MIPVLPNFPTRVIQYLDGVSVFHMPIRTKLQIPEPLTSDDFTSIEIPAGYVAENATAQVALDNLSISHDNVTHTIKQPNHVRLSVTSGKIGVFGNITLDSEGQETVTVPTNVTISHSGNTTLTLQQPSGSQNITFVTGVTFDPDTCSVVVNTSSVSIPTFNSTNVVASSERSYSALLTGESNYTLLSGGLTISHDLQTDWVMQPTGASLDYGDDIVVTVPSNISATAGSANLSIQNLALTPEGSHDVLAAYSGSGNTTEALVMTDAVVLTTVGRKTAVTF